MKLTLATAAAALALASPAGAVTIQESTTGIPASTDPTAITLGPDAHEWFGAAGAAKVGRVAPPLGTTPTYVSLPVLAARARAIAAGPDGNVWYLDWARAKVGRVTPAGVVTEFDDGQATGTETTAASAGAIVAGPGGSLWYVVNSSAAVFHITPAGAHTRVPLPGAPESWAPTAIASGADGNLWFVDRAKNAIVRITPAGVVTQFTAGLTAAAGLTSVAAGGDGSLWFTESGVGKIGRITTSGSITEYPVSAVADPEAIAAGPDGFVWFTDTFQGAIGRVTTAGTVNEYTAGLSSNADPTGIADGADGGLWLTEKTGNRLAHVNTDAPSATTGSATAVASDSAQLSGQVDPRGQHTSAYFEYGPAPSYGDSTPKQDLGSAAGAKPVSAALSALTPGSTYHFRVVATGAGGTTYGTDQTFTTKAPAQPAGVEGSEFDGVLAHFATDPGQATIDWGDGTQTSSGTVEHGANGGYDVTGRHTYAESGNYTVFVTGQQGSGVVRTTLHIADAPIGLHAIGAVGFIAGNSDSVIKPELARIDLTKSDSRLDYTVSVDWGDGSTSAGDIGGDFRGPGLGTVINWTARALHTYAQSGAYTITVKVSDKGGATATVTDTANVTPAPVPQPGLCPDKHSSTGDFWDYKTPEKTYFLGHESGVTETIAIGTPAAFEATAFQCWDYVGGDARGSQTLAARGAIELNGMFLVPVDTKDVPEFYIDTDGLITATGPNTQYDILMPDAASGQNVPLGRVDLGSTPWSLTDLINGGQLGTFGPSPKGPRFGGNSIIGGRVTVPAATDRHGAAQVDVSAQIPLPSTFGSTPEGGPPPTGQIHYHAQSKPDDTSGGGLSSPGGCPPYCGVPNHGPHRFTAGDVTIPGVNGTHFHIDLPQIYLGALRITDAFIDYDPEKDLWTGGGNLTIGAYTLDATPPPPDRGIGFHGNGDFAFGGAALELPYPGVPIFTAVNLQELGVTFAVGPTRFSGDATINVFGGLVKVHGGVLVVFGNAAHPYTYEAGAIPGVDRLMTTAPITSFALGVGATVTVQIPSLGGVQLGSGYAFYISPGYFEFGGHIDLSVLKIININGGLAGAIDFGSGLFDVTGNVNFCADFGDPIGQACLGLNAEVSTKGIGACGSFGPWNPGVRYIWGGSFTPFLAGCDLGPLHVDVRPARDGVAHASSGGLAFSLPPNLSAASAIVHGSGAPPEIELRGPHGEDVKSGAGGGAETTSILIVPMPTLRETLIGFKYPSGGRWTVTALPGSAPITGIEHAENHPPHIDVRISQLHGRTYALRYHVITQPGQSVRFEERAGSVFHVLGTARSGHGVLSFAPAIAHGGSRQIVATVIDAGVPSHDIVVGSYQAPGPPRPPRPTHLVLRRRGATLIVTWRSAPLATAYVSTVKLSDGSMLTFTTKPGDRRLLVPGAGRETGAVVMVMGFGPDGNAGPAATAALARVPPPAKVRGIHFVRRNGVVIVRWLPSRRAVRYVVQITLRGRNGRVIGSTLLVAGGPSLRSARTLPSLRGTATISIRAVSAGDQAGPPGSARFRGRN